VTFVGVEPSEVQCKDGHTLSSVLTTILCCMRSDKMNVNVQLERIWKRTSCSFSVLAVSILEILRKTKEIPQSEQPSHWEN